MLFNGREARGRQGKQKTTQKQPKDNDKPDRRIEKKKKQELSSCFFFAALLKRFPNHSRQRKKNRKLACVFWPGASESQLDCHCRRPELPEDSNQWQGIVMACEAERKSLMLTLTIGKKFHCSRRHKNYEVNFRI